MTQKSKIYLAIIAASLLVTAGSVVMSWRENAALKAMDSKIEQSAAQTDAEDDYTMPSSRMLAIPAAAGENIIEEKFAAYGANPTLAAFNREMEQAIGAVSPDDLFTGDFYEKYFNNPQIQKILLKYSKDPAFLQVVGQMAADKELMSEMARLKAAHDKK